MADAAVAVIACRGCCLQWVPHSAAWMLHPCGVLTWVDPKGRDHPALRYVAQVRHALPVDVCCHGHGGQAGALQLVDGCQIVQVQLWVAVRIGQQPLQLRRRPMQKSGQAAASAGRVQGGVERNGQQGQCLLAWMSFGSAWGFQCDENARTSRLSVMVPLYATTVIGAVVALLGTLDRRPCNLWAWTRAGPRMNRRHREAFVSSP